jgi:transposase
MLNLACAHKIFVASQPSDMRKGFNGLSTYVQEVLKENPLSGAWFIFFSRRLDRVKILYWDEVGLCLWYKLLPNGVFRPPKISDECYKLNSHELNLLLSGIELTNPQRFSKVEAGLVN